MSECQNQTIKEPQLWLSFCILVKPAGVFQRVGPNLYTQHRVGAETKSSVFRIEDSESCPLHHTQWVGACIQNLAIGHYLQAKFHIKHFLATIIISIPYINYSTVYKRHTQHNFCPYQIQFPQFYSQSNYSILYYMKTKGKLLCDTFRLYLTLAVWKY